MKTIIKRNLENVPYNRIKIKKAMRKALNSLESEDILEQLLIQIESSFKDKEEISVEEIQDIVEKTLMKNEYYEAAKNYILYREKRNHARKIRKEIILEVNDSSLQSLLTDIEKEFPLSSMETLLTKYRTMSKPQMSQNEKLRLLVRSGAELTTIQEPYWEYVAGRLLSYIFHKELKVVEKNLHLDNLYEKLSYLTKEGLYGSYILENYSLKEIKEAEKMLDQTRNQLFTYAGLDLLIQRYLIKSHNHIILESVQEMFLGVALHLAMNEKKDRLVWVRKFYDMLSLHQVTMATPTLSNARKPYHQLSSCFIDTVPDSLDGIYHSISSFADVSKFGGGMGMYFGKVRSRGGNIRGFKGASGGVIRWIRVVNDTAIAVDQLGMRQGAVAVYLDAWHKDLPEFLQLRTNNGDDRMKAHDVFPAICYPDLFWKMAREDLNQNWYLMDPHDILITKGYALEDSYGEEWETKYWDCVNDSRISKRILSLKDIIRLILKSAVETGTPFAFNRDTVNKANPNKHQGIIYCSNLCTEITQNMNASELSTEIVKTESGDEIVVTKAKPGDFVVCNLASLCLGHLDVTNDEMINDITGTVVRALDNVIDLNFYPLPFAEITNKKYRSIGLGVSGYHHMLAKNKIRWESEDHLTFVDDVFERIAYGTIKASNELAKERGSYQFFKDSEWDNGNYFKIRHYHSDKWNNLKKDIHLNGMRNAYLMAIAPTSSTSILIGSTAGLDPVMNRYFLEEKKGTILPRTAPELSPDTYWYYKQAHQIDQSWSIKAAGIRQRHIDQSQSVNLWITNEYKMSQLLNLYILAWEKGVKTIYYVRSQALDPEDCESCSA